MRALRIAITVIVLLFVSAVITMAFLAAGNNNAKLFGRSFVCILSGSMEPEIRSGSLIINATTPPVEELKEGDIVTFRATNTANGKQVLITHRINRIGPVQNGVQTFETKGDKNSVADGIINYNQIVGIYTGISIPVLGNILAFFGHWIGLVTLAVVALIIGWAMFMWSRQTTKEIKILDAATNTVTAAANSLEELIAEYKAYRANPNANKDKLMLLAAEVKLRVEKAKKRVDAVDGKKPPKKKPTTTDEAKNNGAQKKPAGKK
jgi:signal peptidase